MILFFKFMIVKNESLNFTFCCLITFMFIKTVFFFLISFFKLKISENYVLKKMIQILKNFTFIVNYEKLTFKTFFIIFIKLFSSHKLKNIFFFKYFFILHCIQFFSLM